VSAATATSPEALGRRGAPTAAGFCAERRKPSLFAVRFRQRELLYV